MISRSMASRIHGVVKTPTVCAPRRTKVLRDRACGLVSFGHSPLPTVLCRRAVIFVCPLILLVGVSAALLSPSHAAPLPPAKKQRLLPQQVPSALQRLPQKVSFLNDVEPILTRAGCNQGACHGSQFGKGGFKLSLAAYDPEWDYASIARQSKGRRVALAAPPASLLLTKPTLALAHQGGMKLARNSLDYQTLVNWLAQGAPGPDPHDPHVTGLRVTPERQVMHEKQRWQLNVWAQYSDGTRRNVTAHTRIASLNDAVATTTPEGLVTACGRGETAIMLRYDGLATAARIAVPYSQTPNTKHPTPFSYVDTLVAQRWKDLGLKPSGACSDAEFIRRASLDVIGTLPTPEESRAFEADRTPRKDALLIDRLLARPEYADYWALKWGDLLRNSRATLGVKAMWSLRNWLHDTMRDNRPYDAFVRDLITAQGSAYAQGPPNYYRIAKTPQELAETTAQVFLGVRLQCAKCHHHPFEKWSQTDYYQFAAFFPRVGAKEGREYGPANPEPVVIVLPTGEVTHPKTGARMLPTPLGTDNGPRLADRNPDPDSSGDRRILLADWLTGRDNRLFAQSIVNRYWGYFLGRGLIHPVDDIRVTNPPSNPELLDALAKDFIAHGCDLKALIRVLCTSRAYRLSASPTGQNRADTMFYSHFLRRRLPAETLLDAISFATGTQEKFDGLPVDTRAIQLPDATVGSAFLDTFGRPPRSTACECERAMEPSLTQSLQLLNGDLIARKVTDPSGRVAQLLAAGKSDSEIVTALTYVTLSRAPRSSEMATALRACAAAKTRQQAFEDLLWALLNTSEFSSVR